MASDIQPINAYYFYQLGNSCLELNLFQNAAAAFEKAIALAPLYAEPYNGLGHVYFVQDRFEEALTAVEQAIELNPLLTLAHQNLGYLLTDLQNYSEAIGAFDRAIDLEPENSGPYYGLGLIYYILQDYEQATSAFQTAITLDPQYVGPRISLAGINRKLGHGEIFDVQISFVAGLISTEKLFTQARYESVCGNVNRAIDLLEETLVQVPGYRKTLRRAADFDFIRTNLRFKKLVEPED